MTTPGPDGKESVGSRAASAEGLGGSGRSQVAAVVTSHMSI